MKYTVRAKETFDCFYLTAENIEGFMEWLKLQKSVHQWWTTPYFLYKTHDYMCIDWNTKVAKGHQCFKFNRYIVYEKYKDGSGWLASYTKEEFEEKYVLCPTDDINIKSVDKIIIDNIATVNIMQTLELPRYSTLTLEVTQTDGTRGEIEYTFDKAVIKFTPLI